MNRDIHLAVCEAATQGLLTSYWDGVTWELCQEGEEGERKVAEFRAKEDAQLFYVAREVLPAYIRRVQELEQDAAQLKEDLSSCLLQCRALTEQERQAILERDTYRDALRELLDAELSLGEFYPYRERMEHTRAKNKARELLG